MMGRGKAKTGLRTNAGSWVRLAFVLNSENLGKRVLSGASFTFLSIMIRTGITIGSMAILARLLSPADFGYVAMATVVTEFAALLGGFGFSNILIQKHRICRLQLDTVFWAGAAVGLTLTILVQLLSFFSAWLFADPFAGELLRILGLTFLLGGLTHAHEALLARLMRFRTEFWIQISVMGFRSLVAVFFAWSGWGVWSLVAGALAGSIANVIIVAIVVPYVPRFRFHVSYLMATWRTSGSYFGNGFLYYISMNVDVLLIGRSLGAGALGYYQNARSLTDEIRGRIAMPLQRVLFPAFSSIQTDLPRLQASVLKCGRLLALVIVPIGLGISAVSDELVYVLYGNQWLAMIPILKMFGFSAALKGATAIASPLFNSQNRVSLGFKFNSFGTGLTIAAVWLALPFGINGVAFAIASSSLYTLVTFRVGLGLIDLRSKDILKILGAPFIAALIMWFGLEWMRTVIQEFARGEALRLLLMIILGGGIYVLVLLIFSPEYLNDLKDLASRYKR